MKRTYGNEATQLSLTGKALAFYNMTDPIMITEDNESGECLYQVLASANEPMHDGEMTRDQLIRWLEDGYDEVVGEAVRELARNWLENDRTGDYCRKITLEEAVDLIGNMDDDVLESVGGEIAPEQFMDAWNSIVG